MMKEKDNVLDEMEEMVEGLRYVKAKSRYLQSILQRMKSQLEGVLASML